MTQFRLLSLSHQTTAIAIREQYSLTSSETSAFLQLAKAQSTAKDILVLSTCNRTEILFTGQPWTRLELLDCIDRIKKRETAMEVFTYVENESEVLSYFFRVSSGLESQILGDAQIISQLKSAYQLSQAACTAGTNLHRLMHTIFSANKRIGSQTGFRTGISSASYAAVDLVSDYRGMFQSPRIAVVGFGEMGQNVCRHLLSKGHSDLTVFNRSTQKVADFNAKNSTHFSVLPLDQLSRHLEAIDILITTPSVSRPLLGRSDFEAAQLVFKVLVDISMPRCISSEVAQLPGIIHFDMDDIAKITQETAMQKKACMEHVEAILAEHLSAFMDWKKENERLETIRAMKTALHHIKEEELNRICKQDSPQLADHEQVMDAMIQKIIKKTVVAFKSLQDEEDRRVYNSLINRTFL